MKTKLISLALLLLMFFNANSLYCQWNTSVSVSGQQVYTLQSGQTVVYAGITISYWGFDSSIWGQNVSIYVDGNYQGGGFYPTSGGFYLPQGQHTVLVVLTYSDNGGSHTSMDSMVITVYPAPPQPPEHGSAEATVYQVGGNFSNSDSKTVSIASGASVSYQLYAHATCETVDGFSCSECIISGPGIFNEVYAEVSQQIGDDCQSAGNSFTASGGEYWIYAGGLMDGNGGLVLAEAGISW